MEADVQLEKLDGAILSINAMVTSIGSNCWAFSQPVLCVIVSDNIISATFGDEEVTYDQLMQIGRKFFLAVYAQKHSLTLNADKRFGVIN